MIFPQTYGIRHTLRVEDNRTEYENGVGREVIPIKHSQYTYTEYGFVYKLT